MIPVFLFLAGTFSRQQMLATLPQITLEMEAVMQKRGSSSPLHHLQPGPLTPETQTTVERETPYSGGLSGTPRSHESPENLKLFSFERELFLILVFFKQQDCYELCSCEVAAGSHT